MKFEDAINYVLQWEGEFSDDKDDRGGATKWGISSKSHPNVDIKNLTKEQAIEIYRKEYWEPNQDILDFIQTESEKNEVGGNENLIKYVFDCLINLGRKNTVLILQRSINASIEESFRIKEDGVWGEKTKFRFCPFLWSDWYYSFNATLKSERAAYYRVLIAKNPSLQKFEKGWLARAYA